jgi:hypothetical protein
MKWNKDERQHEHMNVKTKRKNNKKKINNNKTTT